MQDKIRIAIIDNGINEKVLHNLLENKITVDKNNKCIHDLKEINEESFEHGTTCALIIEKFCSNCCLSSIRILDDNGKGVIHKLKPALKWCYDNNIKVVNLSLGTTHFFYKGFLNSIINEFVNKGMIIIAASANDGYASYPSYFSNVIGICRGDKFCSSNILELTKGIEFKAVSNHELSVEGISFETGESNSYAAPYITALVSDILKKSTGATICEMKRKLYELSGCNKEKFNIPLIPDWITKAYIADFYNRSNAEYYFSYSYKFEEDLDTIIFKNPSDLHKMKAYNKNIVYLGDEELTVENITSRFYWSKKNVISQIEMIPKRKNDLDIPVIIICINKEEDIFFILKTLKELFRKDNYNAYSGSCEIESVLYNLEYIPKELFRDDKLKDFLFWKSYYDRYDLIIFGVYEDQSCEDADMIIKFNSYESVEIICDNKIAKDKFYKGSKEEMLKNMYDDIIDFFVEDENE